MTESESRRNILDRIGSPRLLVLGDLILDRYTWGDAERVSPEAPVLVLRVDTKEVRLGGAASVAMLLRGLEAEVTLAGVIGDDPEGRTLQALIRDERIDSELVVLDATRPTTTKERFVGRAANRHPHQILRVDHETRQPIGAELEDQLSQGIIARLDDCQGVLISDYSKGVCTPQLAQMVIRAANQRGIPVIVDPARIQDYSRYRGATLLKPNRAEAELAAGAAIRTAEAALTTAKWLCQQYDLQAVLITLDRDGMVLVHDGEAGAHFPTQPRSIYDITGAGDMVLAGLGLCLGSGISLPEAAEVANAAAGLEVEKLGVAPVTRDELRGALLNLPHLLGEHSETDRTARGADVTPIAPIPKSQIRLSKSSSKLVSLAELAKLTDAHRLGGKTIVFTNGCFDLLHVGHLACLEEAATLGDVLIVAVNDDASVRRLKGPGRPIVAAQDRAQMIAGLTCVDYVVIFEDDTPHRLLQAIRPDLLAKGGTTGQIVGREVIEALGGQVCRAGHRPGRSTTEILSAVRGQLTQ